MSNPDIVEAGKATRFQKGNQFAKANLGKEYMTRYRAVIQKHASELPEGSSPAHVLYSVYSDPATPPDLKVKAAAKYDDVVNNTDRHVEISICEDVNITNIDQMLLEQLGYINKENKEADEEDSTS
ncbi:hypothetical protein P9477_23290 [Enterobacter mori]|uniref:hypothetical protein n=1 Tax=Enterobacter mori TaxID=539813 RepID=UPI00398B74B3